MENQVSNPFGEEKPKIVHLEKSQSHYEYCRMQMHDIEKVHRRTFIANMAICLVVALLAIFRQYIAGFDLLSAPLAGFDKPGTILTGGIFQILFSLGCLLLGYLAWANFHTLNIIQECWYFIVTFIAVMRLDYKSAVIGIVGMAFYVFSIKEMGHEAQLAELEGYPEFQERFDVSQSDIVIETLLAHKGEHRTKSTLFTTDYSLRRKKKKSGEDGSEERTATKALAVELKKRLEQVEKAKKQAAAAAAEQTEPAAEKAAEPTEMHDIVQAEVPAENAAEAPAEAAAEDTAAESAQADADAIIAEAEAKAKAILEQALAEAAKVKSGSAEQPKAKSAAPHSAQNHQQKRPQGNPNHQNHRPNQHKKPNH